MNQLMIDFQQGLVEQFPEWGDMIRESVYGCGKPFKVIAADMDMSSSELSRRLSVSDDLPLHALDLPRLIQATGDKRPVYWLIEYLLEDPESKRKRAIDELSRMLPAIQQALEASR